MLTKRYFCAQCKKYLDDSNTMSHLENNQTHHLEERTLYNETYLEELAAPTFRDICTADGGEFIRTITTTGSENVEMFSIQVPQNSMIGAEVITLASCPTMDELKFFIHEFSMFRVGSGSAQYLGTSIERHSQAVSGSGLNLNFGLNADISYVYVSGLEGEEVKWKCKLRYLKMQV